ncbi:MAG TPA: protein kinase [Vicinamibacteria bacterium]|nr:protein kinase [Vicinamibacteria bacterium]
MALARLGKFELLDKLGEGAMGEVFRARDAVLEREVAVKIVSAKLAGDNASRQRFLREAKACAQLNHPNIVTVHDYGEEQDRAYIAMELLGGSDLKTDIEKHRFTNLQDKLALIVQILDGVAFAHARGLVHRDLKPANIRVLPNGDAKIMDFGLARRAEETDANEAPMGTPHYMAPEQSQGQPATMRSDVFSLGAIFYELLAGRRPFSGNTVAAVLHSVAHDRPEPLAKVVPDLPRPLAALVEKALAKRPAGRFADAGEMLVALRAAYEVELPAAEEAPPPDATPVRPLGPPPASQPGAPTELCEALEEVEYFLNDRLPPLMAWESVQRLAGLQPAAGAAQLWSWAERQQTPQQEHSFVDLLFHALQRLSVMGDLDLIEKKGLVAYLRAAGEEMAAALPGTERERLRRALVRIGESELTRVAPLENVQGVGDSGSAPKASPGLKRLSLVEQRLRRLAGAGPAARAAQEKLAGQALTIAAREARNGAELNHHLRRLRAVGVPSSPEQVFRTLGQQLNDWALPPGVEDTADFGRPGELDAMMQIVVLAEDPVEAARRYRYLVGAAVEQFNAGNLGGSVEMLELASQMATEQKVPSGYTTPVLAHGHNTLDPARIREFLEKPERHRQLRSLMRVFEAGLGAATLLDEIEREPKRDRRRLLLDLLVVQGEGARAVALERLLASLATAANDYARRNWIYMLRLVPRPDGADPEPEIDAISHAAVPGNPPFLAKEALAFLGHERHPRAAQALAAVLATWERELEVETIDPVVRETALATLDRVAAALARQGSPGAWQALLDHALSRNPKAGPTLDRLVELGQQDLSTAPEVLGRLVDSVREALPRGRLDSLFSRRKHELPPMLAALAGTRAPAIRTLLREIARKPPTPDAGRAAMDALAPARAAAAAFPLSGEFDASALPQLLHRLASASASGTLELRPADPASPRAHVGFVDGHIVSAEWGHREDLDAIYQLFEKPPSGHHAFDAAARPETPRPLGEARALIREGVQRASALRRLSAVVQEDVPLQTTGAAPGTVTDEPEYELVVALWERSCAGMAAERMEAELGADSYRILRPLAQWMEEGALIPAQAPEPEAPASADPA